MPPENLPFGRARADFFGLIKRKSARTNIHVLLNIFVGYPPRFLLPANGEFALKKFARTVVTFLDGSVECTRAEDLRALRIRANRDFTMFKLTGCSYLLFRERKVD